MKTRLKLEPKVAPKMKQRVTLIYAGAGIALAGIAAIVIFFYLNLGNQDETYAQNQNYNTATSGGWTSPATWGGGAVPPVDGLNKDNVNINHNVSYSGNITINNQTAITINGGATFVLTGDFIVNNDLTLMVNGTLIITGTLVANNGANLTVNGGGSVNISGDAEFKNNTRFWIDGNVEVGGNLTFGTNTNFGGNGSVAIGGTGCTDWNGQPTKCTENTLLPVELLSFTAVEENGRVLINWKTATELNNDYFTIERSSNGLEFESIAEVKGNGTAQNVSSYEHIDDNPLNGLSYYRLVQTDFDGTSETFKPVSVNIEVHAENRIEIFPNPLLGNTLTVRAEQPEEGSVEIFDQSGYKIFAKQLNGFDREERMDLPGNLVKGIYFVHVNTSSFQQSFKLVKK